jgi:hypothetical protein
VTCATSTLAGGGAADGAVPLIFDPPTTISKAITIAESVAPMMSLCLNKKVIYSSKKYREWGVGNRK